MSSKLTDKKLKELILEVLQERVETELPSELDDVERLSEPNVSDLEQYNLNPRAPNYKNRTTEPNQPEGENNEERLTSYLGYVNNMASNDGNANDISVKDITTALDYSGRSMKKKHQQKVAASFANSDTFRKRIYWREAQIAINKAAATSQKPQALVALKNKIKNGELLVRDDLKERDTFIDKAFSLFQTRKAKLQKTGFVRWPAARTMKRKISIALDKRNMPTDANSPIYAYKMFSPESASKHNLEVIKKYHENNGKDKTLAFIKSQEKMPVVLTPEREEFYSLLGSEKFDFPEETSFPDGTDTSRAVSDPFGRIEASYTGLSPAGVSFTDIKNGNVKKFNLRVDTSVMATIDSIDGNSMLEKISNLGEFSRNLSQKLNSGMGIGKISSYLRMLGFLSDTSREYESASAGTVFETFLALIGKGIIIGGDSGAADNATFSRGLPVYYSAKLYNSAAISQSDQAEKGLMAVAKHATETGGEGLLYVIGIKTNLSADQFSNNIQNLSFSPTKDGQVKVGASDNVKAINFVILRLKTLSDDESKLKITALKGNSEYPVSVFDKVIRNQKPQFNLVMNEVLKNNYWFSYIPVFENIEDVYKQQARTGAEWIATKVKDSGNIALKDLMDSYQVLKNIELTSEEYTAKSEKLDASDHSKYINTIQQDYSNFKVIYNRVLETIAGKKDTTRLSENKKKSKKDLDKLIEAVILETLRKK